MCVCVWGHTYSLKLEFGGRGSLSSWALARTQGSSPAQRWGLTPDLLSNQGLKASPWREQGRTLGRFFWVPAPI